MKRRVFVSGPARKDIRHVVGYIRLDKPIAAERFKELLKTKIRSLKDFPEKGRKVPELKGTPFEEYRELIVSSCRVVYRWTGKEVRILRVLHARRLFRLFS